MTYIGFELNKEDSETLREVAKFIDLDGNKFCEEWIKKVLKKYRDDIEDIKRGLKEPGIILRSQDPETKNARDGIRTQELLRD